MSPYPLLAGTGHAIVLSSKFFCFTPACRTGNVGHFPSCPHISHLDTFTEDLVYKFGITLIAQL